MPHGNDTYGRTIAQRYGYFVRGRQLIIIYKKLENEISSSNSAPTYSSTPVGHTNGLMLEYTSIPDTSEMLDENANIPLNDTLALALVDYCKAALIDSPELLQQREMYMARFKDKVAKYTRARVGGIRKVIQRNF
tara:strand:- start:42 stop:446 length:405 start_codon:yes stop_codon:yes gene_type:complete